MGRSTSMNPPKAFLFPSTSVGHSKIEDQFWKEENVLTCRTRSISGPRLETMRVAATLNMILSVIIWYSMSLW
jgi:hypothetical protein